MSEVASGLSTDRPWLRRATAAAAASGSKRQQSALTNGRKLLRGVDGRNPWTRRARDLIREHTQDLGGSDNITVAEGSLVRRIAAITSELELLEARFALSDSVDADDFGMYLAGSNCLRRLLETVGLKRRARDVTAPSVAEYIEHVSKPVPPAFDKSSGEAVGAPGPAGPSDQPSSGKTHQRPPYGRSEALP